MNSGKKILCFALAMATTVPMMFTGCANNTPSSSAKSGASTATAKATVTLSLMTGGGTIQGLDRVQAAVNDYLKKQNTGLAIKWETYSWDDLGKKTDTMLQTGQDCDVMNTASWMGSGYISHAQKGEFTDLTKYVTDSANKDLITLIGQDFLDGTKVAGKYYGMPTNKEKAHNFGLLVQTKELTKLGIDKTKIKSLDDIAKYFDQVKKDGLTPIAAASMDSPFKFLDWDVVDADGTPGAFDPNNETTVVDQFTAPTSVAFYKTMKTYHDKGYFSQDVLTSKGEDVDMGTGKFFCDSSSLMPGKAATQSTTLKVDLTQIDITPVEKTNRETLGALLAIPKASTHPDEAFKFIKLLYTDKTLINLMTYGVEGKDYTKKSDNVIKINSSTDFTTAGGWIMGNEFNNYLTDTQSTTLFKDIEAYNKSAKVLDDLGFVFDNSSVKTQYSACQGTVKKYYPQLFYGTCADVDATVAAMKKELTTDGEPALIAAMQTQYDTWKKSK